MNLSPTEIERYSRQLILSNWSGDFQVNLKNVRAACSSQHTSTALYLAAAGIGEIVIVGEQNPWLLERLTNLNPEIRIAESNSFPDGADVIVADHHEQTPSALKISVKLNLTNQTLNRSDQGEAQLPSISSLTAGSIAAGIVLKYLNEKIN